MLRRTYENERCTVARTLEVIGERWTLLIVRDALTGLSRFDQFRRRLGIAANVLSVRLDGLVGAGVLERVAYHAHPPRYEYRLTPMGQELAVVVVGLMQWGNKYLAGEAGPPLSCHHDGCGGAVEAALTCRGCGADLNNDKVGISYARQARHRVLEHHT
jgi:DNA-binding HxlR family transcriptional regulator